MKLHILGRRRQRVEASDKTYTPFTGMEIEMVLLFYFFFFVEGTRDFIVFLSMPEHN